MSPGEIYWVDLESGRRPMVIVSRELLNRGSYVVAVPCTTAHLETRRSLRNCVPISAGKFGVGRDCVIQAVAITFLDQGDIDHANGPIGKLDSERLRILVMAIGYVIEAECEPD